MAYTYVPCMACDTDSLIVPSCHRQAQRARPSTCKVPRRVACVVHPCQAHCVCHVYYALYLGVRTIRLHRVMEQQSDGREAVGACAVLPQPAVLAV